ncbi:hypothetical protein IGI43_001043 [Enterococcus sp. AZ126]
MMKIQFLLISILFLLAGIALTHYLKKKCLLPNRWIIGLLVFLVILIPLLLLPNLSPAIKQGLYLVSGVLSVIFFESSRLQLEKRNQPK